MLDLSLVLSSRFELTTLSRKATVGFSLLFNEKFALLGGIRAAQWERILLQESRFRTGVQDWTRNLYEPLCKLIKLCQQLKEWIFFYHYMPWSRCQKVSLLRERSNRISEKLVHVFYIRAARYIFSTIRYWFAIQGLYDTMQDTIHYRAGLQSWTEYNGATNPHPLPLLALKTV